MTLSVSVGEVQVRCGDLDDIEALEQEWEELYARSHASFFLSWQWIGCWLRSYQPKVMVLRAIRNNRLIGLALLSARNELRHHLLHTRCLRLHQTGLAEEDQIWIEYNGFLSASGEESPVNRCFLAFLMDQVSDWDEFRISGIRTHSARELADLSGLTPHIYWRAPCFGVNLAPIRETGGAYVDSLSRNTRHQIRRCRRLYEERDAVELYRPGSVEGALELFESLGPLHIKRWGSGEGQSGFANPRFVRFHRELIRSGWQNGSVDLIALRVGGEIIAGFYNLIDKETVYFYLGAAVSEPDNRLKPGLLGHALVIDHYCGNGFGFYDFMGGNERYKTSLGQIHDHLCQISLQRPLWRFRIENAARSVKNLWRREAFS